MLREILTGSGLGLWGPGPFNKDPLDWGHSGAHQPCMTGLYNLPCLIACPMGIEHGPMGAHCLLNESWPLVAPSPIPAQ